MSYQVRHLQPSRNRYRSAGFHSVEESKWTDFRSAEESQWEDFPPAKRRRKSGLKDELDPSLWKSLPEDVFEKVVAYLPFPGVLRCRAVNNFCKDFVFTKRFQEIRASVPSWEVLSSKTQYLLMFATVKGVNLCTAYDSVSNKWLAMPPLLGLDPRAKECIAGDGGLLCFRSVNTEGNATLFIYNPVTSTCRELPAMRSGNSLTYHTWILTHLIYNRFTSTYKLLVLTKRRGWSSSSSHLETYDSLTHSWTTDTHLPLLERKYKLTFNPQVGACNDNFFYFVAKEGIVKNSVQGLVVYDIFKGVFREKLLYRCEGRCPKSQIEMQVVQCKGQVHMVVREDDDSGTKGISLCTLNPSKEQKIEDAILFESFFHKWGSKFPPYRCVSVRDGLGLLLYENEFQILADDLSEEMKLPTCPFRGLQRFVHGSKLHAFVRWGSFYDMNNVVSEAHFQPNPLAMV